MLNIKDTYTMYKQDVFLYLISLTHNHNLSEDLLSETFLSAIKSFPSFKGNSDIKTWLFSIARYKWYEHLRKNRNDLCFDDLAEIYFSNEVNIEESLIHKDIAKKIISIIESQDKKIKDIITMRINGYSFYEISLKHNISQNSARVIDFRTKKKIRELLKKEGCLYE